MALRAGETVAPGTTVTGLQAETLGSVAHVLTDDDDRPAWAWVRAGHAHGETRALPLARARHDTTGDLWVPWTKAQLTAAPRTLSEVLLTPAEERELLRYWGLPEPDTGDRAAGAVGGAAAGGPGVGVAARVEATWTRAVRAVVVVLVVVGTARGVRRGPR